MLMRFICEDRYHCRSWGLSVSISGDRIKKAKRRSAKSRANSLSFRTETRIAKSFLKHKSKANDFCSSDDDAAAYAAFLMDMKKKHKPELPLHYDSVERATELRWRLQNFRAFEKSIFDSIERGLNRDAVSVPNGEKNVGQLLEILFRTGALEKIAKYEASLREQVKKTDVELEALAEWRCFHSLDRGSIDSPLSEPLDWEEAVGVDRQIP